MRLRSTDVALLRVIVSQVAPDANAILLFGSRIDDQAKGGDIDLMIDFNHSIERPALLSTRLAVSISRALQGRAVDVTCAPLIYWKAQFTSWRNGKVFYCDKC